jgi:hypothetical protein
VRPGSLDFVDVCYMEPTQGMVQLEEDLGRSLLVAVDSPATGVSADVAAEAIFTQLRLAGYDFSIHAFEPADFLVLCSSLEVRDRMVFARHVSSPRCSLSLLLWTHREGALQQETPFLAELELRGIPAHAWAGRTAVKLLEGSGLVDHVAAATASRTDMSCFQLSVWTHDVAIILAMWWLAVLEPGSGLPLQVSSE